MIAPKASVGRKTPPVIPDVFEIIMTTMRMNVRDFDEAYEFLKAHGFRNARGEDHTVESKSARSCLMISPSGFSIQLTQHIRNHD